MHHYPAWSRLAAIFCVLFTSSFATAATTVLVDRESVWKYDDTGTDLGTAWSDTLFDDSGWSSGPGPLGYGEPYINTVVSYGGNIVDVYPTTYFRTELILVDDPAGIYSLFLEANYDDGYVAYLNGTEVSRQSMPEGVISYATLASLHDGGLYELVDISAFIPLLVTGTNYLAVEVHPASLVNSDLTWDGKLWYSDLPVLTTRGPYLQAGSPTGVTIRWRTDEATDSRVRYGTTLGSLAESVTDATSTTEHELTLSGLTPATQYYYAFGSTTFDLDGDDVDHHFDTPPVAGSQAPVRVWVLGDSGTADVNAAAVRTAYENHPGSADTGVWLMLGDNAYLTGTDAEYQAAVFDMYPDFLRTTVLWSTRGNHDQIYAGDNNDYYEIFTMPTAGEAGGLASGTEAYYSFDYANIHFICLDSYETNPLLGQPQLDWFEADLAATAQDWVIPFWHHPPYSKGSHDSDDSFDSGGRLWQMRENAVRVIGDIGGDLILAGHSHSYERSFLLDGHFGPSGTLVDSNRVDAGDGREGSDGPYVKPTLGTAPHEGSVFSVVGSSGKTSFGPLNHPVMISSLMELGSLVIDVDGNRLDAVYIDETGAILDEFTIIKGVEVGVAGAERPANLYFGFDSRTPNPMMDRSTFTYHIPASGRSNVSIFNIKGQLVRELHDGYQAVGEHTTVWDGRSTRGQTVSAGAYFAVLRLNGETRSRKITLIR